MQLGRWRRVVAGLAAVLLTVGASGQEHPKGHTQSMSSWVFTGGDAERPGAGVRVSTVVEKRDSGVAGGGGGGGGGFDRWGRGGTGGGGGGRGRRSRGRLGGRHRHPGRRGRRR